MIYSLIVTHPKTLIALARISGIYQHTFILGIFAIALAQFTTMINDTPSATANGTANESNGGSVNFTVKTGLAQMLKGGVIMDVVNAEQVLS